MKNKLLNILLLLIIAIVCFNSCKKEDTLLNKYPRDAANAANYFIDANSARASALSSFSALTNENWFYKRYFIILTDIMTDDSYTRPINYRLQCLAWDFDATFYGFYSWYRGFSQAINNANFAIDGIPTSTDKLFTPDKQAPYIAVAKLVKGFCYLQMTTLWGDVPYFEHFLNNPDSAYIARTPKKDVMLLLIEDLKYATANLPDYWSGADAGLPTKAAGAAMLAKAYLYNKDYANAETAANNALTIANADGYSLMNDYVYMMSQQSQTNGNNTEFIFTLNFTTDPSGDPNEMMVERNMRDAPAPVEEIYGGGWGYALPSRNLYDAFETAPKVDPRRGYSIWAPGDFYGVYQGATVVDNGKTYNDGDSIFYQQGWSLSNTNTRKLFSPFKDNGLYIQPNDQANGYHDPLLRYADLMLFYSEALIEQGKITEGMAELNMVRARPSVNMPPLVATDQVDARAKLRHERRVELNMEGMRLFDLMRWGALEETLGSGLNGKPILMRLYDDNLMKEQTLTFPRNNLWPIPQPELDANPNAKQNPGW